ncbi:hypothetical protein Sm713_78640 [Streptomyces sp. TS71-3]|nr:hypothetical protein Sm713_78640 [Streptomyces sp. TS71-3]
MGIRKCLATLAATGALVGGMAAMAPAASAASGGTAPACIQRTVYAHPEGYTQVYLYNTCGKTMHVNVVVNNGPDMGCKAITNKHQLYHVINWGTYQKTVVC